MRELLDDPRVQSVGTKDDPGRSEIPDDLSGDPRIGRYWQPGHWRLPHACANVYFVGPWRLLTTGMLREALRRDVATLRLRVATSWVSVPLGPGRAAKGALRGIEALSAGGKLREGQRRISRVARGAASAPRKLARALTRGANKIDRIRRTLFIRYLDNLPDVLIASALDHATERQSDPICVFLSYAAEPDTLRALLADPRVHSVGIKDHPFNSALPEDLKDNPRVGRFWEPGAWVLPAGATKLYFVGPWRLIRRDMVREAVRRGVTSFYLRVSTSWAPLPLATFRAVYPQMRPLFRAAQLTVSRTSAVLHAGRRTGLRMLLIAHPGSVALAARLAGPEGLHGTPLERTFARALEHAEARVDAVSGRVVHVCGNLQPGGAERQLVYTLEGLSHENLERVQLLCHNLTRGSQDRYDFYLSAVEATGVKVGEIRRRSATSDVASLAPALRETFRLWPKGLLCDVSDLYWEFSELRPQIVHAWLDWDNVRAGLAAVLAGVPKVILSGRNINPSHFELYAAYYDPAYRALARIPTVMLINNSRAGGDDYADWIGIPRTRISVIHNGVDFGDRKRLTEDASAALRQSLGIPVDAFVVGGAFRLEQEKRPLLWIEAAVCVARKIPNAWFVLFGQGRMRNQLLQRAQQAGIADRLVLPGVTNEIISAMSAMDVLLLTSFGEGLPNVLLEAQWAGTPVVTTDVGGAKEAINDGVTGWAIASDRAPDLAEKILWLQAHPQASAAVRETGPAFVRAKFGVERMIREVMHLYGPT